MLTTHREYLGTFSLEVMNGKEGLPVLIKLIDEKKELIRYMINNGCITSLLIFRLKVSDIRCRSGTDIECELLERVL